SYLPISSIPSASFGFSVGGPSDSGAWSATGRTWVPSPRPSCDGSSTRVSSSGAISLDWGVVAISAPSAHARGGHDRPSLGWSRCVLRVLRDVHVLLSVRIRDRVVACDVQRRRKVDRR